MSMACEREREKGVMKEKEENGYRVLSQNTAVLLSGGE